MTWNSIPLSAAGSLAVSVVAMFFVAFQTILFVTERKLTSNAWAALFSLSSAGYAFFVFLQFIGPAGSLQQQFERAQFSSLVLMVYSSAGYTFSFLKLRARWFHFLGGSLILVVLAILWLSDLIVSSRLVYRSFRWLPRPYVEPMIGPLGIPFMILIVVTALFSIAFWIWTRTPDRSARRSFAVGLSIFTVLGIHDALVTMGVMTSVQFVLEYGFLGFATAILNNTVRDYIRFRSTADSLGRLNKELGAMAVTDELTKLANRRGFDTRFDQEWRTLGRQKRQSPPAGALSVILCDVDFFKEYNDTYGHLEGDRCLETVAAALARGAHRPGDFVARLGGDEFALLLPDTPLEGASAVAAAVLADLKALGIPHQGSTLYAVVTVSMGIASTAEEDIASDQLIARADRALYRAKTLGRNRAEIYGEDMASTR